MALLQVSLFRDFALQVDGSPSNDVEGRKARELLAFLLLNQERPHRREALCTLLWEESGDKAQRNMRQTLWQLQRDLEKHAQSGDAPALLVDAEWIQINPSAALWCDVPAFRRTYDGVRGLEGQAISETQADDLRNAIQLYRGGLLEGWYLDWCLVEREYLQNAFLIMLDKLMDHCETRRLYEEGIVHGVRSLKVDNARERTHRRLMRLFALNGDRSGALRQYLHCAAALQQEFGLGPSARTVELYERIRNEQPLVFDASPITPAPESSRALALPDLPRLSEVLTQIAADLGTAHQQVMRDLNDLAGYLPG